MALRAWTTRGAALLAAALLAAGCRQYSAQPNKPAVPVTAPQQTAPPREEAAGPIEIRPAASAQPAEPPMPREPVRRPPSPQPAEADVSRPLTDLIPQDLPAEPPPAPTPAEPGAVARTGEPTGPLEASVGDGRTEIVAASMLQVNETFITVEDILRDIRPELQKLPAGISGQSFRMEAARLVQKAAQRRVVDVLIYAEAERRLDERQKEQIESDVQDWRREQIANLGAGSRARLEEKLAAEGLTLAEATERYRRNLTARVYLHMRFSPAISVNRQMLYRYYRAHLADFTTPKKVQMQIIAAPFRAFADAIDPRAAARRQIDQAAAALQAGRSFDETAREYSKGVMADRGGVWPAMAAGNFREQAVEQAAFALGPGGVSDIIETDTGFWIVKARQVEEGRTESFEQAQEQIDQKLRDEQYAKLTADYFDRLMERATVTHSQRFLEFAVQEAARRYWRP